MTQCSDVEKCWLCLSVCALVFRAIQHKFKLYKVYPFSFGLSIFLQGFVTFDCSPFLYCHGRNVILQWLKEDNNLPLETLQQMAVSSRLITGCDLLSRKKMSSNESCPASLFHFSHSP